MICTFVLLDLFKYWGVFVIYTKLVPVKFVIPLKLAR